MAGKAVPLAGRFEKHFIPEPNSGCWLWLSATVVGGPKNNPTLYGIVGNDKKTGQPHCKRCHADREAVNRAKKKLVCEELN